MQKRKLRVRAKEGQVTPAGDDLTITIRRGRGRRYSVVIERRARKDVDAAPKLTS